MGIFKDVYLPCCIWTVRLFGKYEEKAGLDLVRAGKLKDHALPIASLTGTDSTTGEETLAVFKEYNNYVLSSLNIQFPVDMVFLERSKRREVGSRKKQS